MSVAREFHSIAARPVGIRCVVCKLDADDGHGGTTSVKIQYGKGELGALARYKYICDDCIDAIVMFSRERA